MSSSRDRWTVVALVVAGLLAFGSTLGFDFVFDDKWIVRGNDAIRGWSSLITLWTKPYWVTETPGSTGLYRPLLMVIFSTLWNLGLRFPIWFHLLAVSAHTAATLVVWRLLRRAVVPWTAAVGALWFAVHPIHIEAVANIANSSEVLVTVLVVELALVVSRANARTPPGGRMPWSTAVVCGVVYAAALLIKESGVTAPALALLAAWGWSQPRLGADGHGEARTPHAIHDWWLRWNRLLITCAAAFCVVVATRIAVLGSVVSDGRIAAPGLRGLTASQRVWAMLSLGPKIAGMLAWPRMLNPLYGPRVIAGHFSPSPPALEFLAMLVFLAAVSVRACLRGDRRLAVALAWPAIAFLPASNLMVATGQILAERTLYLPSVGVALAVGMAIEGLAVRFRGLRGSLGRPAAALAGATVCVLCVLAARTTRHRARAWGDHDAFFAQLIAADSGDYHRYWASAVYQQTRGRGALALQLLDRAYTLEHGDRDLVIAYVRALMDNGKNVRAASVASTLMSSPNERANAEAVALYLDALGRSFGADSVLSAGVRLFALDPLPTTALYIGSAHEVRGERAAAVEAYRAGLRVQSDDSIGAAHLRERLEALGG